MKFIFSLIFIWVLWFPVTQAEVNPLVGYTLSGHVTDAETGEELIGANIYAKELGSGTVANKYGFYSLTLNEDEYTIGFSYIGYVTTEMRVKMFGNQVLNIELSKSKTLLEEVSISTVKKNANITSLEMGTVYLPIQSIRRIPALMGEVDVIKAIQLLPGVSSPSEGSSGFSVRGGSIDQNLVLLDEATVYNASHMMGFFSVFNNDAIKDVNLYKGDIPASSGGRLASLLDVRMKDGNNKKFSASGGIGSISSRLTMEGPIIKNRTSFLVAGRRTYADLFLPLLGGDEIKDSKLHFYDLNMKINHIINENNRLFLSGYFGRDVFANEFAGMEYGNRSFSFRWNHLFSQKLFSNFTLINSYYDYELGTPANQPNGFLWKSDLSDLSAKADFIYYLKPEFTFKFGAVSTYHQFTPGIAKGTGEESLFTEFKVPDNFALESGIYAMSEHNLSKHWSLKYGLRFSVFQNIGQATIYNYDQDFMVSDSVVYNKGELFNTFSGLEPRLGLNYTINEKNSIKASYNRTRQYLQLAQNSTAGTPLDIWFSASPNVKPQVSDQFSLGYFKNMRDNRLEASVEAYYKSMNNTIDFRDHAVLLLNPFLDGEVRTGKSWSYGIEFLLKISEKKFNGWLAYTLSKTERKIEGINNGKVYDAPYDKPHDISLVLNYQLNDRLSISGNWVYSSGLPSTFPTGRYELLGKILPIYSDRNDYRYDNYHRMDLSVTLQGKKNTKRNWQGEWNFSVYNAYKRKNTWAINFVQDETDPTITYAEKTYLFSIIPAVTYNFKF
ncbi:MAG: TonB-dependent receptor [Bacteroidales bacterium]|nr:TonB-dependent receptor [Bacteroidales bacterium]